MNCLLHVSSSFLVQTLLFFLPYTCQRPLLMHYTNHRQLSTKANSKRDTLICLCLHQRGFLLSYATPTSHLEAVYILPQRVLASNVVILACATYPIPCDTTSRHESDQSRFLPVCRTPLSLRK